jgi:hypothetical protein
VKRAALRVATHRFRATSGRRWGGYFALRIFSATTDPVDRPGTTSLVSPLPGAAVVLGHLVLPARLAARTPTARLLRAE